MTSAEFLSGLRKGDKLIPIITLVVYLGDKEWDGPKSLHDMLDFKDNTLRRFVPDYKINLLSPKDLNDDDFKLFHTSFGFAMKMLKYRNNLAEKVISENGHTKVDRETAVFLNNVANLELEFDEEEGGIDMEGALDKCYQREKVKGAILVLKNDGASDDTIIEKVSKSLGVNGDYVRDLLTPKNNA